MLKSLCKINAKFANFVVANDKKANFTPLMDRISKDTCLMLCDLLALYGVRRVVLSPGSRNAPLIVAVGRSGEFLTDVIIDERQAAFAALGMALASSEPVALVCTSGTALLNYTPAVAEAYYRRVPLVVVSADRPAEWIDQDDSQTIRQPGALANIVRDSLDVSEEQYAGPDGPWWLNRRLNDVLANATGRIKGPVHINIRLAEPLTATVQDSVPREHGRKIDVVSVVGGSLPENIALGYSNARRVLVIIGFMNPDPLMNELVNRLADSGCVVLKEAQSNISSCSRNVFPCIDAALKTARPELDNLVPDLVVTMGGSLLSRHVKTYLRRFSDRMTVWAVGYQDHAVDCFKGLDARIDMNPDEFVECLLSTGVVKGPEYAEAWHKAVRGESPEEFASRASWSDFKAVRTLIDGAPEGIHLQVSNGTAIRYVQLFRNYGKFSSVHCNRGVSGIDGCTSTAAGFASVAEGTTLLLTGDMSAAYDIGALSLPIITPRLRIAVLNNAGGGIFRFIPTSRDLPELEKYFVAKPRLPLERIAEAYGFDYFEADSEKSLLGSLPGFFSDSGRPALLNIITPAELSAEILSEFFR